MARPTSLAALLGLPVVVALVTSAAHANPPFNIRFTCRVDVDSPQSAMYKNLAPWYTYFPYDPHPGGYHAPHFPTWPQTWPPVAPKKDAMSPMSYMPVSYAAPGMAPGQPVSYQYGVPSYWYGR